MDKKESALQRSAEPLKPTRDVELIDGGAIKELSLADVTNELVGQKAFGLASIPLEWSKPFFVISGLRAPDPSLLINTLKRFNFFGCNKLIIRSSGVDETINERGVHSSFICSPKELETNIPPSNNPSSSVVHWVVQELVPTIAKGHLSNERRIFKNDRDWLAEIESSSGRSHECQSIAIRPWRDSRVQPPAALKCNYRERYTAVLEQVARWAFSREMRIHFEWVWDGSQIYIVQADEWFDDNRGVKPESVVAIHSQWLAENQLSVFEKATKSDFECYRKIANADLYRGLGYTINDFFVLKNADVIYGIINGGTINDALFEDLDELTKRPLVIRTDGLDIPTDKRTMLPRSDELRTKEEAVNWLVNKFRRDIIENGLSNCQICLIAHHFIPATASAWCQAHPDQRRVRIESLWGIPEGLYWYSHDVFDVDTVLQGAIKGDPPVGKLKTRPKLRYKGQFIAPDESGDWVLHKTAVGPDWNRSIHKQAWIDEIAWTSRKIAQACGYSVVVMWFIDLPHEVSSHEVIPWYHEKWNHSEAVRSSASRKLSPINSDFTITTKKCWELLNAKCRKEERISRVFMDPKEPDLVRNASFAKALGELAKKHQFVIELSGGILSHAYYLLQETGCAVEICDLYATNEEEIEYNKLVRDNIPAKIMAGGENVEVISLEGEALIESLKRKVVEEAFEVFEASNTVEIASELADLQEIANALRSKLGITKAAQEETRKEKLDRAGGFERGVMLARTSLGPAIKERDVFNSFPEERDHIMERTVSNIKDLPDHERRINIDKRHDSKGGQEHIFKTSLPVHIKEPLPHKVSFTLDDGESGVFYLDLAISLERVKSELICRIKLINSPQQTQLLFDE